MATQKSSPKLITAGPFRISWKRLLVSASLVLNVSFVVILVTISTSTALDGLFMENGLVRYCSAGNDDKFKDSAKQVTAMREYVCDRTDADTFFKEGLNKYFDAKGIKAVTE